MREQGLARQLPLALRFALRELRGGLSGFYIFLACIALGTAAIGSVITVAGGMQGSIAAQGQSILGGDIAVTITQRPATDEERQTLEALGTVSESVTVRSMARKAGGLGQSLVELKAVDGLYPLYGRLATQPEASDAPLFAERGGVPGAAAPQLLFDRLGLKPGARLLIGDLEVELRAVLGSEPDSLSSGFGFAPRLMISTDALGRTGLIRTGSLADYTYKVRLAQTLTRTQLKSLQDSLTKRFEGRGIRVRSSGNAAPALSDSIERFAQFLALVGLCALLTGGVGVANAVQAHLDSKRQVIATLKSLGASHGFAASVYLIQIMAAALAGVAVGLGLSVVIPFAANAFLQRYLLLSMDTVFQPWALLLATVFGLLTALGFALAPIGRTRGVSPQLLFRDISAEGKGRAPAGWKLAAGLVLALAAALAIGTSEQPRLAVYVLLGAAIAYGVLDLAGRGAVRIASGLPRPQSTALRMAILAMHRPGSITRPVMVSLGLGLTLLTAISQIDANLRSQLSGSIAGKAPDFFFLDIQSKEVDGFRALLSGLSPNGALTMVPMLRGRITALKGIRIEDYKVPPEASWVTRGDRGITYARDLPGNSSVAEGEWWPQDYSGEPLVSFALDEAKELGLSLGDSVTVTVLGRDITAKIANFRQVQWRSLSINFVMVFSPGPFKGAPHSWLATLSDPSGDADAEAMVLNRVTNAYPAISSVRVKDALTMAQDFMSKLLMAVRVAASVAIVTSVLVLAGALAAGNRARLHDAVILKMLGARRRTLVGAFALEFMLAGLAAAVFAVLAGLGAAWFVIDVIMNLAFEPQPETAIMTTAVALAITIGFGLAGTWRLLGQKAAPVLRGL